MSTPINIWRKNFHSPPPFCLKLQQSLALGIHNEKTDSFAGLVLSRVQTHGWTSNSTNGKRASDFFLILNMPPRLSI